MKKYIKYLVESLFDDSDDILDNNVMDDVLQHQADLTLVKLIKGIKVSKSDLELVCLPLYQYKVETNKELRIIINSICKNNDKFDVFSLNWIDVSSITDLSHIFEERDFDINIEFDISNWDTSNVTDMSYMFKRNVFVPNVSNLDTSSCTNMEGMFEGCRHFNCDISKWDTSNVVNMSNMFNRCENFNSDISKWNVSKVTSFNCMFKETKKFNSDISNWNIRDEVFVYEMFSYAKSFNQPIGKWNSNKLKKMSRMLYGAISFDLDLSSWDLRYRGVDDIIIGTLIYNKVEKEKYPKFLSDIDFIKLFELYNKDKISFKEIKIQCMYDNINSVYNAFITNAKISGNKIIFYDKNYPDLILISDIRWLNELVSLYEKVGEALLNSK